MKGLLTILLFLSLGAKAQVCCVLYTPSAGLTTPDTIGFHFDSSAISVPGMVTVTGDAHARVISVSVAGTTITGTTGSTSNWTSGLAACVFPADGISSGSTIPVGALGAAKECWFSNQIMSTSVPQFVVGGLNPSFTYDIYVSGTTSFTSVSSLTAFNFRGASLLTAGSLTAISGSTPNTTTQLHFGPVAPDGSGNITMYMGKNDAGQQYGFVDYLILKKH